MRNPIRVLAGIAVSAIVLAPAAHAQDMTTYSFGGTTLRWEQHSEFTTYTWELPSDPGTPFHPGASSLAEPMTGISQPGPLLVALDLHLLPEAENKIQPERLFDRASLAVAENSDGLALFESALGALQSA